MNSSSLRSSIGTAPDINEIRRSANYHPSVWGDTFVVSTLDRMAPNLDIEACIRLLKSKVEMELRNASNQPTEEMILIDALQRLGVAYHFKDMIEDRLHIIFSMTQVNFDIEDADNHDGLYIVALYFRLLRQQGYCLSSDVFRKFRDENGEFKAELGRDARSLLCLYEASHLRVQGEEILEEALIFSRKNLEAMLPHLSTPLAEQVKHSLEVPLHKGMPRLEARHYISVYETDVARNDTLLELAMLDFNRLQTLHQRELHDISRWWKDIDFASKLPFARDRLVECYFWILGVNFEPKYSFGRNFMTKIIALASVIDDIYDVYGSLEELKLFTEAVERWEVAAVGNLPKYMQVCYLALLDVVKEMENKLTDEGRSYRVHYAKEAMKALVRAYFAEANWFNKKYMPTFEEYLGVSVMSSGYPMLAVQSLVGMEEIATKQAFDWVISVPKIVKSCALIARLVDDLKTHKVEQERGDAPSGVECYMSEYGVSEEEAYEKIRGMVEVAWQDINEECQKPESLPLPLLLPALNLALGMEEIATKQAFDWVISVPKIVKSCALIARLVDDLKTHKVEQERGDAPSGVECYMWEYGVSEEEACEKIRGMVEVAWQDINEECQKPESLPLPLLLPALNLARLQYKTYNPLLICILCICTMNSSSLRSSIGTAPDSNEIRRSANYHPSVWGDTFMASTLGRMAPNLELDARIRLLKSKVEMELRNASNQPKEEMILIDALQRLGVGYHFEDMIEDRLHNTSSLTQVNFDIEDGDNHDGLYIVALYFRLLRQQGYCLSSDVFRKFRDENGEFKAELGRDARSLLCLYEASHLRVQGEEILEEALIFSRKNLEAMLPHLSTPLAEQVKHSLEVPLHKGMPRLEARHYISVYETGVARNNTLLELAMLDFNRLQTLHQRELKDISRWWKDIDFASKLPFARDRLVECYFWILGVNFEPKYSFGRNFMTKIIALASVIDDIYDVYGSLEELKLFTEAVERWEVAAVGNLPKYMQVCYLALLDVVKEMENKLTDEGRSYRVHYAKEAMKALVRAYFTEANWFNKKYMPTFEEYLGVSVMSSGYPMLAVQSLVGMEEIASKQAFDWALSVPKIVKSCALIARLVDDLKTHKVEQERGDAPSGVECYMWEYGVSEEEACEKIRGMVEVAWQDINEECQKPESLPLPLLLPALNLGRMMEVIYQQGDGYSNSTGRTKDIIKLLLVHPLPISTSANKDI
ncbi:hypothetical protein RJ640_004592 [Escallonia rubra]|uniref:Uncharacterized protein n=1 Tax=Escallonia rubra TaxID=112253 RepID=A0AA88UR85_9ASTE|nr:hypothetical protein RJ640_004592 [Escallonia rubra]